MTSINSDYMSQMVLQSLTKTDADMTRAMQRLSTGKRINNAGDDAAGLSIASKLKAQVNGLNAAMKNAYGKKFLIGVDKPAYRMIRKCEMDCLVEIISKYNNERQTGKGGIIEFSDNTANPFV